MSIYLVGVSHKTAPVEIRERLAIPDDEIADALAALVDRSVVGEASIFSTCNRVEVLAAGESSEAVGSRVRDFLCEWRSVDPCAIMPHLYTRSDRDAVHHLFRVASSLDSLVVGEPQILGQVRAAYRHAVDAGTVGRQLDPLFQSAFAVAKRVRTETLVGANAVSLSYVAVELGRKIFDSLKGKTVLLVGAGEMAELAARHFADAGAGRMLVSNRTPERAAQLAERFPGASVVPFERLDAGLAEADVVLCSTAAPDYVVTAAQVRRVVDERRHRPFFLIDISVPRQVDPRVGELDNVFLFDVDDLQRAVEANVREREREASVAETIVESEVAEFVDRLRASDIGPTVSELKNHLNDVAVAEFERLKRRLGELTPEQEEAIRATLLPSIVNKISHPMILHMRDSARADRAHEGASIWRRIFRLGGGGSGEHE